ncbi:hydroxymethylpyrimidine kinase [Flavobacteriaceae bacterium UJ101]|nr:hydroxymethylpyrimidine kinase [Flavobacteriaceae bacterium UJ101]
MKDLNIDYNIQVYDKQEYIQQLENRELSRDKKVVMTKNMIVMCTQGGGIIKINNKPQVFRKGFIFFLRKGFEFTINNKDFSYDYTLLTLPDIFINNRIKNASVSPYLMEVLKKNWNKHLFIDNEEEFKLLLFDLKSLKNALKKDFTLTNLFIIEHFVKIILLRISTGMVQDIFYKRHKHNRTVIKKLYNLFEQNQNISTTVEYFAQCLDLNIKTLRSICKSTTNQSTKKLFDDFLISKIDIDIIRNELSFKEISYKYGFKQTTNFSKFYKNNTNMTPTQYRNSRKKLYLDIHNTTKNYMHVE